MTQNKRYAVTGGIGSGKSAVIRLLEARGFPVLSCDAISDRLWNDREYRAGLSRLFPSCTREGDIDRKALSALVFSSPEACDRLDAYAHPRIMEELLVQSSRFPVSFSEVPLLFEKHLEGYFDGVIAVRRPVEARIASVMARDGLTREEVTARMARQVDPGTLGGGNCYLLENAGTEKDLANALDVLLKTKLGL